MIILLLVRKFRNTKLVQLVHPLLDTSVLVIKKKKNTFLIGQSLHGTTVWYLGMHQSNSHKSEPDVFFFYFGRSTCM